MAHITLIRPPAIESFRFSTATVTPPLGLAYLAAAAKTNGHGVSVIDSVALAPKQYTQYFKGYCIGLKIDEIVDLVPAETELIGVTVIFTHEWPLVSEMVGAIKKRHPKTSIVIGGEHVTSLPDFCMLTSLTDYAVTGEGEETLLELITMLDSNLDPKTVDGLVWRQGDNIVTNRRRMRCADLDAIAEPCWELFDLKAYHENRFTEGMYSQHLTVPILATRGCPYQCTYCSAPNMWLPRWIPRDPIKVVDEIEYYVNAFGARNFPFQDLTAIVQKDWIVKFCNEIIDRRLEISWQLPTGTRSEAIDREVAGLLKKSGLIGMAYAPESGSETTRKYIKKKMKTDSLFDSIDAAVSKKLNVAAFMVIGFPHDEKAHFVENLPFIRRLAEAGVSDMSVSFFMALPGTELFYSLYDAGELRTDRKYFRHILSSLSLIPSKSYSPHLSILELFYWKLRFFIMFYSLKKSEDGKTGSFVKSLWIGMKGLIGDLDHDSRVQTALRNAVNSAWISLVVRFGPYWMDRRDEVAMFADWADKFDVIRQQMLESDQLKVRETDTTKLHERNVGVILKKEHLEKRLSIEATQ